MSYDQDQPSEENVSKDGFAITDETPSAERKVLRSVFSIMLATKTIFPQAKTDTQRIELLQAVMQSLLECLDEGGVEIDTETYSATVLGLSNIAQEGWA